MKKIVKYIVANTYKPLLVKYLSGYRTYTYKNIRLNIPPEVFHPGFFYSTKILLRYLSNLSLSKKLILELGAGSGLISIYAAQKGASVTATDINATAINCLYKNCSYNKTSFTIIKSDLFKNIPPKAFDIIVINPPYYKKQPISEAEFAWYCGENGEYYQDLFKDLKKYIHHQSMVIMSLCDDCDLKMIEAYAARNRFKLMCVYSRKNMIETNFIYSIKPVV